MVASNRVTIIGVRLGSVFANLASIASFSFYIAERTASLPTKSGLAGLNVVLHLAVLTAIAYGMVWSIAERLFGWSYGAGGGDTLPSGWSAIVLSLSVTLPLALVPFLYQKVTGVSVLLPLHWRAVFIVILFGVGGHLLMYGTASKAPNGLRQRIAPAGKDTQFATGLLLEAVYSLTFIGRLAAL